MRKVPLVLALLTRIELTQGAITQAWPEHRRRDALRRAKGTVGGPPYQELRRAPYGTPQRSTPRTPAGVLVAIQPT
jgi:hypothetical protein